MNLTPMRAVAGGLTLATLAFVSCSHSGTTGVPIGTPTSLPTSVSPFSNACLNPAVAYEPDGGKANAFHGVQTIQFQNTDGYLCNSNPTSTPAAVNFASSVGPLGVTPDFTGALALLENSSGTYTLAQDIFGGAFGQITPVGAPYDVSVAPSPEPSTCPNVPVIPDGTSVTLVGTSTQGSSPIALVTGPGAKAIVALTSLTNAPPQYGCAIPFPSATPPPPRSIVQASPDISGSILLARGPVDLLAFAGKVVGTGYQYSAAFDDPSLGSGTTLRGLGNLAFDPADISRVLVGGNSAGAGNALTLITGLPKVMTKTSSISVPGNINSITIDSTGTYAYVATDAGLVVVNGVGTGFLSVVKPGFEPGASSGANALPYINCNGRAAKLSYVSAARISAAGYLVALGTQPGTACASGYNASVVAIPFSASAGSTPSPGPVGSPTPTPAPSTTPEPRPSSFVQNNVVAPPSAADYFLVH